MMLHCEIRCFFKRSFSVERRKNRIAGSLVSFSKPRSKSFKGSIRRKSFCYSRVTKNCRDEKKARNQKCVWKHLSEGNPEVTHGTNVIFQYFPIRPAVLGIIFRSGCILQVTRCSGFRSVTSVFHQPVSAIRRDVDIVDTWHCSVDSFVFWKCSQLKMFLP